MSKVTEREEIIVDRVLNFDYHRGHDRSFIHPENEDFLFYGFKKGSYGLYTCLGVIDRTDVGFMSIDFANGGLISKRHVMLVEDLLEIEDPSEIVGRYESLPSLYQVEEIRRNVDKYRTLLGMFERNYDHWQTFITELKEKETERIVKPLEASLEILGEQIKTGAQALLNMESRDPVHDFLMVVSESYRNDEEALQSVGGTLAKYS